MEVARYLASRRPRCPIIIHSSNADRARMMAGEFELAGGGLGGELLGEGGGGVDAAGLNMRSVKGTKKIPMIKVQ